MSRDVLDRALADILHAERALRKLAEESNGELREILTELAYRISGEELEEERREDPMAPLNWAPAQWREFFEKTEGARLSGWSDPEAVMRIVDRAEAEKAALETRLLQALEEIERIKQRPKETNGNGPRPETTQKREPDRPSWPEIPRKPPIRFARKLGTGQRWRREALCLHSIAVLGWSARLEILERVGEFAGVSPKSGSLKRLMSRLDDQGLLESDVLTMFLSRPSRLAVCRLSETGRELARALGWEPVESDWEKLLRLHEGDRQGQHTAGVLSFAYHARRRDWEAIVMPTVEEGSASPDVLVTKGEDRPYVEVEFGEEKTQKWRGLAELQGFVAICAPTEAKRADLVNECKLDGLSGRATDLESLIQDTGRGPLWLEEW